MIIWNHTDGTSTVVDGKTTVEEMYRVMQECVKTVRGEYPSINDRDTIEDICDLVEELS